VTVADLDNVVGRPEFEPIDDELEACGCGHPAIMVAWTLP
jgi:hypothetical protein